MSNNFKLCGCCKQLLPVEAFGFKNKATGRLQSKCKECSREYAKQHYQANRETYVAKAHAHNQNYRERNAALVAQMLEHQSCVDCGSHEHLTYYTGGVGEGQPVHMAVHCSLSKDAVLAAIARSVVVCRTCLGQHFGASLESWQHLNAQQRAQLQQRRAQSGQQLKPHDYYKAYRRTDGSISGY